MLTSIQYKVKSQRHLTPHILRESPKTMVKMPHWPIPYQNLPSDPNLTRISRLLELLDNPQTRLPPVIHIAGTNGKGSSVAYLKSIMQRSGYRVHSYISPHLVEFNERIELDSKRISDALLHQIAEEVRMVALNAGLETTFFEGTTAIAMVAFSRIPADVLLLEVGIGGAYDATNVIAEPALSIITPISYDHTELLGPTLHEIATAKAGIIKKNCPTVISWQPQEALAVLLDTCIKQNSPALIWGENWHFSRNLSDVNDNNIVFSEELLDYWNKTAQKITPPGNKFAQMLAAQPNFSMPKPSLAGLHQYINAATSVVAALHLAICDRNFSNVLPEHIRDGVRNAIWPARMQYIRDGVLAKLLPPGSQLILDGAHNSGGAAMLKASLDELNLNNPLPLYVINGRTRNRNIADFLIHFKDICETLLCVEVKSEPLAESADKICTAAKELGMRAEVAESVLTAVEACVKHSKDSPLRIVICGSLYLAGDVLRANYETPQTPASK